jgi:hypothetical protein
MGKKKLNNYSYILDNQGRIDYVLVDIWSPKYGLHQMPIELEDVDLLKDGAISLSPDSCIKGFYAMQTINGRGTKFHRRLFPNALPDQEVMHGPSSLDNRRRNLKLGTRQENQRDQRRHRAGRLYGTSLRNNRWRAYILQNGKQKHIGYFDTELEAHQAWLACKKTLRGE